MIAAIYARKSTEQTGVSDDQKSVARQVEHARAYAKRKGWTLDEACVFVDDGISGAEFAKRPGFVRLMASLSPRPRFHVLIMSEESRLGREQLEVGYALKQIVAAGVRVFLYLEDRERTLNGPIEKAMLALQTMSDELEREKASLRVRDAMRRKAEQRHVTGGQCFGYRNVDVMGSGADGRPKRQHVRREIDEREAAVVRRIFELCARGEGLKGITKILNEDSAPSPRAQQGRPQSWAPSSVRSILYRESYRGVVVWNRTKKRDAWGVVKPTSRPVTEWVRVPAEHLRIVSEALWDSAHAQLTERRVTYHHEGRPDGHHGLEARGGRRSYLLSGFARCAVCGGSMQVVSRESTTGRLYRYGCGRVRDRGFTCCTNTRMAKLDVVDGAVREFLANEVLRPAVLERALDRAIAWLDPDRRAPERARRRRELTTRVAMLDGELANLAEMAARGGNVPVILEALRRKDTERRAVATELDAPDDDPMVSIDPVAVRRELRRYVDDWQALARGHVSEVRDLLTLVLRERIAFQPIDDGAMYELRIPLAVDRLITTVVPALRGQGLRPQRDESACDTVLSGWIAA